MILSLISNVRRAGCGFKQVEVDMASILYFECHLHSLHVVLER